ncbi:MAG: hypothetical protein OSJ72_13730 [Lachnospiraceae bacterium]|nr:hypothetical protein [Lachnospiraceae bacterium]
MSYGSWEDLQIFSAGSDTGLLFIWNDIEKRYLLQDTVKLDEDGTPLNEEYDDFLLWSDLSLLFDYKAEETINTWIGKAPKPSEEEGEAVEIDSYEDIQYHLYGRSGDTAKYESREALLAEFGFADSEPMYRYFDRNNHLKLELYTDEDMGQSCGFAYTYRTNSDLDIY